MAQQTVNKWDDVENVLSQQAVYPDAERIKENPTLLGTTLVFKEFEEREGPEGNYAVVLAERDGTDISFSIGGVVFDQLLKAKAAGKLPFEAMITEKKAEKSGRMYWTLAAPTSA